MGSARVTSENDFSTLMESLQKQQVSEASADQLSLVDNPFAAFGHSLHQEFVADEFAAVLKEYAAEHYLQTCTFRARLNVKLENRRDWDLICGERSVKPGQVSVFLFGGEIERIRLLLPPIITEQQDINQEVLQSWRKRRLHLTESLTSAKFFYVVRGSVLWPSVEWIEPENGVPIRFVQELVTGEVLQRETLSFGLEAKADIYLMNSLEDGTEERSLTDLDSSGLLRSATFDVFGANESSERAEVDDSGWLRYELSDGELFHQVQTYFTLTRILNWFKSTLNFDNGDDQIAVFTDTLVDGRDPDNAAYTPGEGRGTRTLQFGVGKQLRNLSLDADVAAHEFAHHVIWQSINSRVGGARILHEGFADYFAFAVNGDGNLAESVVPGKPFLRTAYVPDDFRYDNPKISRSEYQVGSMWAAMLWSIRLKVGKRFDSVVYSSLALLDGTAGIDDALLNLLFVDRQQVGEGNARCTIMDAALARGFAEFLRSEDGSGCGYDLQLEADRSAAEFEDLSDEGDTKNATGNKVGKTLCGVSGAESQASSWWMTCMILLLPMLFALLANGPRNRHRRGH